MFCHPVSEIMNHEITLEDEQQYSLLFVIPLCAIRSRKVMDPLVIFNLQTQRQYGLYGLCSNLTGVGCAPDAHT